MKKFFYDYWLLHMGVVIMLFLLLIRIPLGTFNESSPVDTVGHFVLPLLGSPLLFVVGERQGWWTARTKTQTFVLIVLVGICAEALWEIFEFVIDIVFGLGWQPSNADTMADLILATIGAPIGALLFQGLYGNSTNK